MGHLAVLQSLERTPQWQGMQANLRNQTGMPCTPKRRPAHCVMGCVSPGTRGSTCWKATAQSQHTTPKLHDCAAWGQAHAITCVCVCVSRHRQWAAAHLHTLWPHPQVGRRHPHTQPAEQDSRESKCTMPQPELLGPDQHSQLRRYWGPDKHSTAQPATGTGRDWGGWTQWHPRHWYLLAGAVYCAQRGACTHAYSLQCHPSLLW